MSMTEEFLVDSYLSWIKSSVSAKWVSDEVLELTTPFLDRHNDRLQVYAERMAHDLILLTDDGYIIAELKSSGVENRGRKREELIGQIVSGYGVEIRDSELQTTATPSDIGQRLHSLVQAMLSVDDMYVLSQTNVGTIFTEDVARYLDTRDIRYVSKVKFPGRSGLDHMMDFVIPKSRNAPERVVQIVNSTRRDRVENVLFAINDARTLRGPETEYFAVINDKKDLVSSDIFLAFEKYEVKPRSWSDKEHLAEELAA